MVSISLDSQAIFTGKLFPPLRPAPALKSEASLAIVNAYNPFSESEQPSHKFTA